MNDEKEIETTLPEDESLIDLEDMEDEELPPPEEENEVGCCGRPPRPWTTPPPLRKWNTPWISRWRP